VRYFEESAKISFSWRNDRLSFGTLLQTDLTSLQHVQEQTMYYFFNAVNIGDKIDYSQRKNENLSELIQ